MSAQLPPPTRKGLDGYLLAGLIMFVIAPISLPTWMWAVWARRRTPWWALPAVAAAGAALAAVGHAELVTAYRTLGGDLVAGIQTHGLQASWSLGGAVAALVGRSVLLTSPVGIPLGLAAASLTSRPGRRTPIPLPTPTGKTRPVPVKVGRSPFLATAVSSDPPGDLPPEWRAGKHLVIPDREAGLSSIIVGRPGSGKSVLIARKAYLHGRIGKRGIVADCKGEADFARDVVDAYLQGWEDGGHRRDPTIHLWPSTPLSAWTDGPVAVANRLLACWAWNPRNEWHREPVAMALRLALQAPGPEVTSSVELIDRLRPGALERLWEDQPKQLALVRSVQKDNRLDDISLRIGNLMASLGSLLDGDPARPLGTADLTVLSLPVMAAEHDAAQILRVLLADMASFVVQRKDPDERAFIIVDEMSAVEGGRQHMIHIAERGRSAGVACDMAVQSDQGLGDDADANRLLGSVNTVVLFNTAEPERLIRLAGSRRQVERTAATVNDEGRSTTTSTVAWVDQVDANIVKALPVGHAFIMSGGRAQLAEILRPPSPAPPARPALERP
jgi:hypothetical protein